MMTTYLVTFDSNGVKDSWYVIAESEKPARYQFAKDWFMSFPYKEVSILHVREI